MGLLHIVSCACDINVFISGKGKSPSKGVFPFRVDAPNWFIRKLLSSVTHPDKMNVRHSVGKIIILLCKNSSTPYFCSFL